MLGTGCAQSERTYDDSSDPTTTLARASMGYDPLGLSCDDNSSLLDVLSPDATAMFCVGATPEDLATPATDPCAIAHGSNASCKPELGYRCSGEVKIPRSSGARCPPDFRPGETDTECIGLMPRFCSHDGQCPARTRCDRLNGGVCVSGCRSDEECDDGDVCNCEGTCVAEGTHAGRLFPDLRRPTVEARPAELDFKQTTSGTNLIDLAQVVIVSMDNPARTAQQTLHAVGARGFMVSCAAAKLDDPRPPLSTFGQDCSIQYLLDQDRNKALWVLPYALDPPTTTSGSVHLQVDNSSWPIDKEIPIFVAELLQNEEPSSGWYRGTFSLVGAGIDFDETVAFSLIASDVPPATSRLPVTAWVELDASNAWITLYDPTHTLTSYGQLKLHYSGAPGTSTAAQIVGTPEWFSGTTQQTTAAAAFTADLPGTPPAVAPLVDDNATLLWDADTDQLQGIFGIELRGADPDGPQPALVLRFTVSPSENAPEAAAFVVADDAVNSIASDPWIARAADTFSPRRFDHPVVWAALTASHSLVNCLNSPRSFQQSTGTSTLAARCSDTVALTYGVDCDDVLQKFDDAQSSIATMEFLKDRYEVCCPSALKDYGCSCFDTDFGEIQVPGTTKCRPDDTGGMVTLNACPIDSYTISPFIHRGVPSAEPDDYYIQAATCAMRVATFDDISRWTTAAFEGDVLMSPRHALHPSLVDAKTGELYRIETGGRASLADAWFANAADLGTETTTSPASTTNTPFFDANIELTEREMAVACLDDLSREVPTAPLPEGLTSSSDGADSGRLAPIEIPVGASGILTVIPAFAGLKLSIVVAGVNTPSSLEYADGTLTFHAATDGVGTVTSTLDELGAVLNVHTSWVSGAAVNDPSVVVVSLPPTSLDNLYPSASWDALRQHAEALFQTNGCVDIARFHLELDWLAAAAKQESLWGSTPPLDDSLAVGSRLLQRRLAQWLSIHAFVARHSSNSQRFDAVHGTSDSSGDDQLDLDETLDAMEQGISLLLYPEYLDILAAMPAEFIAEPDYRLGSPDYGTIASGALAHHEQILGLPVVVLDTLAAYLELLDRHLDGIEAEYYLQSWSSNPHSTQIRAGMMERSGRTMRFVLAGLAVANGLHGKAKTAGQPSWEQDWRSARAKLSGVWRRVTNHATRVVSGANPLDLAEDSVPLYFIEPGGTNQRFFASSDYLIQSWATPAIARTATELESARQAMLSKRDAAVRQVLTEQDHERRVRETKIRFGTQLRTACGLTVPATQVFDEYRDGMYDLESCYRVPNSENPTCLSRIENAWQDTDSAQLKAMLDGCGEFAIENTGAGLYTARRELCALMRAQAVRMEWAPGALRWNPFDRWLKWQTDPDYGVKDGVLDDVWTGADGEIGVGTWDNGRPIRDYLVEFIDATPGGSEALAAASNGIANWDLMDGITVSECGNTLDLPGSHGSFTVEEIARWTERVAGGFGLTTDSISECNDSYCRSLHRSNVELFMDQANQNGAASNGAWCDQYFYNHMYPTVFAPPAHLEDAYFAAEDLADCYRGTLAELELEILSARQQVRQALSTIQQVRASYDTVARSCVRIANLNENISEAMTAHYKAVARLNRTANIFGAVAAFMKGAASAGATVMQDVSNVFAGEISTQQRELDFHYEQERQQIQGVKEALQCWTQTEQIVSQYGTQVEAVRAALFAVARAHVRHQNLVRDLRADLAEGEAIIAAEEEDFRTLPDFRHNYWLDERIDRFESDFAWAKRLTYMAMLAAEYELQQSFDLRLQILSAVHPDDLQETIHQIEQQQATRGINGRRPESKTIVRSLRDGVLKYFDSTTLNEEESGGDKKRATVEKWVEALHAPGNAVFSDDGTYLGQGLRFDLEPSGELLYRCAERLWSVSAALHGDLLGVIEPRVPVFILKRNTFASQWCAGKTSSGEQFQPGSIRPSVNLFVDGASSGQANETETFSWAFVDAWINVKRKDFYSDSYHEGASSELAGRGLYGEYMLLFPQFGFLDNEVPLDRVEDVLLKFEYVSVDNGGSMAGPPPSSEPPNFDGGFVHDLQANVIEGGIVQLTWKPSTAVVATGKYAVFRDGVLLDDNVSTESFTDAPGELCGKYTVSIIDTDGDALPGAEAPDWAWGCDILHTDDVLDILAPGAMTEVDSETSTFSVAVLLWKQSAAVHAGSYDRTWSMKNGTTTVAQAMTTPPVASYSGAQYLQARSLTGSYPDPMSSMALTVDTDHLTLQIAEIDRVSRNIRVSTVTATGSIETTSWTSTDGVGTLLPAIDLYLLSAGQSPYGFAPWGGPDADEGLIGAVVFDGVLTESQWISLAQGMAPWDVVGSPDILHAYNPGQRRVVDSTVYFVDLGGGAVTAVDAQLRNGDEDDIAPR